MERAMRHLFLVLVCVSGMALGQDKPRIFVQGKGSQNVTASGSSGGGQHWGTWGSRASLDSHDEAMQVTRDLQKECSGAIVTLDQSNADYTVMLNRESKHNRGLLRTNSQVQVANRLGDILGTSATRTVGNASKDACQLILADWSQHGRIAAPAPTASSSAPPQAPHAAETAPPTSAVTPVSEPLPPSDGSPRAKLQVDSIPTGADIEIDGSFVGNTPSDVQVTEGEHSIVVIKKGFTDWKRMMKISAGSSVHLNAELEKAAAPQQ